MLASGRKADVSVPFNIFLPRSPLQTLRRVHLNAAMQRNATQRSTVPRHAAAHMLRAPVVLPSMQTPKRGRRCSSRNEFEFHSLIHHRLFLSCLDPSLGRRWPYVPHFADDSIRLDSSRPFPVFSSHPLFPRSDPRVSHPPHLFLLSSPPGSKRPCAIDTK